MKKIFIAHYPIKGTSLGVDDVTSHGLACDSGRHLMRRLIDVEQVARAETAVIPSFKRRLC